MKLRIDQTIQQAIPNCQLGYVLIKNAVVRGTPPALVQELLQLQNEVANVYDLDILPKVPRILAVRTMYKKLAFDPSRYRPASEALVRRVLQNKGLHYVNSAVDASNYCSIKFLLPFGLYDLDQIAGDVTYKLSPEGTYTNIAGKTASTEGKPFLTDGEGGFGNPTSDSSRTAVTLSTKNLLSVIYADEEVSKTDLHEVLDFAAEIIVRHNGGIIADKALVTA